MKQFLLCGQHRRMLQVQQVPAPDINIFPVTAAAQYYPTVLVHRFFRFTARTVNC